MIRLKKFSGALVLSTVVLASCQSTGGEENAEAADSAAMETEAGGNAAEGEDAATMDPMAIQPLEEVSEEDLQKFSEAATAVQEYGQQVQPRMIAAVQEAGLDPQRYSEIMQAQQMPDNSLEVSEEEQAQFEEAQAKVDAIQAEATETMENKIEEAGLTVDHYQAILATVRQDPELQQKLMTMQAEQNPGAARGAGS